MKDWKGLNIESEGTGISESLSYQVNLLGTLLGQVIREQAGEKVFSLVETLRQTCKKASVEERPELYRKVQDTIGSLSMDELFWLIRSFTAFFHLVNEAERQEIARINRAKSMDRSSAGVPGTSIEAAVAMLRESGLDLDGARDILSLLDIQPTLTAHPTEARRGSILYKQNRIAELLCRVTSEAKLTDAERDRLYMRIYHEISLIMATEDIRADRLGVEDEVENGLFYCKTSIWEAVADIYRDLDDALVSTYGKSVDMHPFLRYRSWIGGDRDGNPHVTPLVTRWSLGKYRQTAMEGLSRQLRALWQELSISRYRVEIPEELEKSIRQDGEKISLDPDKIKRYRHEPFRLKIFYMLEKLDRLLEWQELAERQIKSDTMPMPRCSQAGAWEPAFMGGRRCPRSDRRPIAACEEELGTRADGSVDFYTSEDFVSDLRLIEKALEKSGLSDIAARGGLSELIRRAIVFGFHLVTVDIRQHSGVHEKAVEQMLRSAGVVSRYSGMREDQKCKVLEKELANPRPLIRGASDLQGEARDLLETFGVMGEAIGADPDSIGAYIVSMTHEVSDMLEVLLIAKEAGLWRMAEEGKVESPLDVVPLFETITDLKRSGSLMARLFENPVYQKHLAGRENFQEIMLGYSDSNKDGGYWSANWALENGHQELAGVCQKYDVRFRFFHGRGGSIGRGGGRAGQAILSMPENSRNGAIRFTEQGEVISFRYARTDIAHRHLEQIVNAVIRAANDTTCDTGCEPLMRALMDKMAERAGKAYRDLIDEPTFWDWYRKITPIDHIGHLPIASRPVSRKSAQKTSFDDLRAIPWVFSWTQTRYNVPGWYGIGSALAAVIEEDKKNLDRLKEMWKNWSFFRSILDNAQLEMARTRFHAAAIYNAIDPARHHDKILEEFEKARRSILKITGQEEILDNHPVIRKVIALRNPYTDVLNLVQIELLHRWRREKNKDDKIPIRRALFLSINGIAAAMQNTG